MKKLQELTLFDKFLFDETMDIPEAHEAVLQIIFGDDNLKLLTPAQTEKEIRTAPWLRSIRLDVYAIDQEKRIYNTEAQKVEKKDLVKRSRFYQSLIDSSLLEPGEINFNQMNDTCIIMITPFDLFGEGRYQYTFRSRCDENPALSMEDGAIRISKINSHSCHFKYTLFFLCIITAHINITSNSLAIKIEQILVKIFPVISTDIGSPVTSEITGKQTLLDTIYSIIIMMLHKHHDRQLSFKHT